MLGINNETMPIEGFNDPFITCAFIDDERIAVSLFYNPNCEHIHFILDNRRRQFVGNFQKFRIPNCNKKNFPYKTFTNVDENEFYTFYRQG